MEKYCFCFDIDGTLLTSNHKMSEKTIQTLNKLQENGHKVVIATGRNYGSVKRTGILDLVNWDGYVFNNGQCVLDKDLNVIAIEKMSNDEVQAIVDTCNSEGLVCLLERVYDWFIVQEANEWVEKTHEFFNEVMPPQEEYNPSMEIVMAIVYAPKGYDYQLFRNIKGVHVDEGTSHYADLVREGYHKYKGIEKILKHFDIEKSACFGDGTNDVDMIRYATIGVAMGQGVQVAKDASNFITKSCDDEGIAYACKHLGFIK